jgi:hypothetical protein
VSFALVPDWVLRRGLSATAIHLYVQMALAADGKTREAFHGHDRLAALCGCSPSTVKRALRDLQQAGALTIQPRWIGQTRQSNLYVLPVADPLASPVEGVPLPLVEPAVMTLDEICLEVAMATVRAEGKVGIRNLKAYCRPRALEIKDRHRDAIEQMLQRDATPTQVVEYLTGVESPLGDLLPVATRPRLPEFRQTALDETSEWADQQPIDLEARRAHLASVREALRGEAVGG